MKNDSKQKEISYYKDLELFFRGKQADTNREDLEPTKEEKEVRSKYDYNNKLKRNGKPYKKLTEEEHNLYKSHERKKHRKRRLDPRKREEENEKRRAWHAKRKKNLKSGQTISNQDRETNLGSDMNKFSIPNTPKRNEKVPRRVTSISSDSDSANSFKNFKGEKIRIHKV